MASYNQNTEILTLLILLCLIIFTQAKNHTLINQMCSKTCAPNVCISCIESSNISEIQSDEDIIQAMLGCGNNDALILEQRMNKILDDPNTQGKARDALILSNTLIQAVIADGGIVQTEAILNFDGAMFYIDNLVLYRLRLCNSALNASEIIVPPPLFSGLFIVEADYKLSYQLISSIKVSAL